MSWTVEYVPEKEMVRVVARDQIFTQDARAQAAEATALIKKHDADFVLADYSAVQLEVSLANLYWLPDYYLKLGAPQHIRIAVILSRTGSQLESYQFYQVACKNAGYNVKLFDCADAAERWFGQLRPRPSDALQPAKA